MTTDFSLTDRTTWIAILTVIAAALSDVFHNSFAPYVPAAATLAAAIVVGLVALAKHHYRAALVSVVPAVTAAVPQLPATDPALVAKATELSKVLAEFASIVGLNQATPATVAVSPPIAVTAPIPPAAPATAVAPLGAPLQVP